MQGRPQTHEDSLAQPLPTSATVTGAEYPDDNGIERRRHPRYRMDTPDDAPIQVSPQVDRRQRDRRNIDEMRAELQRTYMPSDSAKPNGRFGRGGVRPGRIVLLLVALIAGGSAAYLTTMGPRPVAAPTPEVVAEVIKEPRLRVLVAKAAISIGQRLSPDAIGWEDWPEGSVLDDYITAEAEPAAAETLSAAVARFEFFPGDPIREQKLVRDAQGYLSAVLEPGMRGVSVAVSAVAASGGFISPNDRVDVVLTRSGGVEASETVLRSVRVLAINSQLGQAGATGTDEAAEAGRPPQFAEAIATLELDADGAQVIIGATALGQLTLVLRSMSDFEASESATDVRANQAIRLTSPFWTSLSPGAPQ